MARKWWRRPLLTAVVLGVGWLVAACSQSGAVGSGQSESGIVIQTSSMFVTVDNRAGQPLVDVKIALKPASGTLFTNYIPRLESGAKKDLALSDFRSIDGTGYSLRLQRPRQVIVTASDLVGKKYETTVPWSQ
jgi:hypothetical protein